MHSKSMKNYYSHKNLFFLIFILITLCFNPPVTHGETQSSQEIQESEEFENSLVRNVQNDYRNGFGELLNFINSLNDTLTSLNAKLATLDTALNAQNTKMEAGFKALNERLSAQDTTQSAKAEKISRKTNLLISHALSNLNTWDGFERIIRAQAKEIKIGNSFNGSTLSDIKSRAAQFSWGGWHSAIVFVNHLDEAIDDFTIYDKFNKTYNPAPNTVPGRTQEVFTFSSRENLGVHASFSYQIPSFNARVAAISYGTVGVGLAFVPKGADMKTYYESCKGIEGSTVWECCNRIDRNLSVDYKNLYARMFADDEGNSVATLRIELIKLPLDE